MRKTAGSTKTYAMSTPARNSPRPAIKAGTMYRFSCLYSAGERNRQTWAKMIGDASTAPITMASLSVMRNASAGRMMISFPSGRYGAMGSLSSSSTLYCWTRKNPIAVPTSRATRLHRMRHLSSSRWSKKGISLAEVFACFMGGGPERPRLRG
jgi:hypothetical protein